MKKVKEIRFRPKTAENDLKTKLKQAKKFLAKGHQVKVTILFKRWETKTLMWMAEEKMDSFTKLSKAKVKPRLKGHILSVTLM